MGDVHGFLYTDPACPWSWAAEPALRRLSVVFGDTLPITYVMGGLAREFARPHETMRHWLDMAAGSGMPCDPRLWLDAPPRSSYPACLAVKAAGLQGLDGAYLRRARVGLALEGRTLDRDEALIALAATVDGLDADRFARDLRSDEAAAAFEADLREARAIAPERRGAAPRVSLPSVRFTGEGGEHWAYDSWDPIAWEDAAIAAGAIPSSGAIRTTPDGALLQLGPLTVPEAAAVCHLAPEEAAAQLWRLVAEGEATVTRHPCGVVFAAARQAAG